MKSRASLPLDAKKRLPRRVVRLAMTSILLIPVSGGFLWGWELSRPVNVPEHLGNRPEVIRRLEACPNDRPVSFAVVGDTVILITGGGGARLDAGGLGTFHHAVILSVYPDHVTEDILVVPSRYDLEEKLEHMLMTRILPHLVRPQ